jgi:hypothetical protein
MKASHIDQTFRGKKYSTIDHIAWLVIPTLMFLTSRRSSTAIDLFAWYSPIMAIWPSFGHGCKSFI